MMEMPTLLTTVALLATCVAAAWFDLRERRIPNLLTVGAFAAALLLRVPGGFGEVGAGLTGALLASLLALPFFLIGGLGGGDLKFLAAVGAFLGPSRLFFALLITALFGAMMAIVMIVRRRALTQTFVNFRILFSTFGLRNFSGWKGDGDVPLTIHSPAVITVPYGVAISAGALAAWFVYTTIPGWSFMEVLAR
jgi:prepilin peptidase CpaA